MCYCAKCLKVILDIDPIVVIEGRIYHAWCA